MITKKTAPSSDSDTKSPIEVANNSGFPLQLAVEHAVANSRTGWSVYVKEHPWQNPKTKKSGFIDLVFEKDNVFLSVECKRVRNSTWVFLITDPRQMNRSHAVGWVSREDEPESGHLKHFGWTDLSLTPGSPLSIFCAARGQEAHARTTERIASELVEATEAFAFRHPEVRQNGERQIFRFYFNVIVTTAELVVCLASPSDINLQDGAIGKAETKTVPFVRFEKPLLPDALGIPRLPTYSDYGDEERHTVFIVNSAHILDFLRDFEIDESAVAQIKGGNRR